MDYSTGRIHVADPGIERIPPDPSAVEIVKAVLEQNARILAMNERLIGWTSSPMLYRKFDADNKS